MKQVSQKQARRNAEIAKIKRSLPEKCVIPYCYEKGVDLCHILPKGPYPEYYTKPENLVRMCRKHHNLFDNDIDFRQRQKNLFLQVANFDLKNAVKYFRF